MSTYEFPAWVKYGKHESGETTMSLDLPERDVARLRAVLMEEDHEAFYRCDAVSDIYRYLHSFAAYEIETKLHEMFDKEDDESHDRGREKYSFYIDFPIDLK